MTPIYPTTPDPLADSLCLYWTERAKAKAAFREATRAATDRYVAKWEAAQKLGDKARRAAVDEAWGEYERECEPHPLLLARELVECQRRRVERRVEIGAGA